MGNMYFALSIMDASLAYLARHGGVRPSCYSQVRHSIREARARYNHATMESIDTATGAIAPPKLSTDRVRSIFSSIADRYELFNALSSFGVYRSWLAKMAEIADIEPTDIVLDVAGGTGDVTFTMAEKFQPAMIVCTDLVPEMLEVAKAHVLEGRGAGVDIQFAQADGQALPFDDGTFDAVTMAYGLRNMPCREKALSEVLRVLVPGGSFTCLDFSTPEMPAWRAAYDVYLKVMIPFWGKVTTGDASGFRYLASSIQAFPDQAGVARMLEDAGFEDVCWFNCSGGIAAIHSARKPE